VHSRRGKKKSPALCAEPHAINREPLSKLSPVSNLVFTENSLVGAKKSMNLTKKCLLAGIIAWSGIAAGEAQAQQGVDKGFGLIPLTNWPYNEFCCPYYPGESTDPSDIHDYTTVYSRYVARKVDSYTMFDRLFGDGFDEAEIRDRCKENSNQAPGFPADCRARTSSAATSSAPASANMASSQEFPIPPSDQNKFDRFVNNFYRVVAILAARDDQGLTSYLEYSQRIRQSLKPGKKLSSEQISKIQKAASNFLSNQEAHSLQLKILLAGIRALFNFAGGSDTVIGDLNGDGRADAVVMNRESSTISSYLRNSRNRYELVAQYSIEGSPLLTLEDVDVDSIPDLVLSYKTTSGPIKYLIGLGNGKFKPLVPQQPVISVLSNSGQVCVQRASTGQQICANVDSTSAGTGATSFGFFENRFDGLYRLHFHGSELGDGETLNVTVRGVYYPGIDYSRMGAQVAIRDVSNVIAGNSCSLSRSDNYLSCSIQAAKGGLRWGGRCVCLPAYR